MNSFARISRGAALSSLFIGALHSNSNAIAPFVLQNVPYDPATDFTPITYIGYVPNVLVINPAR